MVCYPFPLQLNVLSFSCIVFTTEVYHLTNWAILFLWVECSELFCVWKILLPLKLSLVNPGNIFMYWFCQHMRLNFIIQQILFLLEHELWYSGELLEGGNQQWKKLNLGLKWNFVSTIIHIDVRHFLFPSTICEGINVSALRRSCALETWWVPE